MASSGNLEDIKRIIYISTMNIRFCQICDDQLGRILLHFDGAVNHYLEEHGYRLLHIGQETQQKESGEFLHCTVAVLGK